MELSPPPFLVSKVGRMPPLSDRIVDHASANARSTAAPHPQPDPAAGLVQPDRAAAQNGLLRGQEPEPGLAAGEAEPGGAAGPAEPGHGPAPTRASVEERIAASREARRDRRQRSRKYAGSTEEDACPTSSAWVRNLVADGDVEANPGPPKQSTHFFECPIVNTTNPTLGGSPHPPSPRPWFCLVKFPPASILIRCDPNGDRQ